MANKIKFTKPIELEKGVTINGTTIPTDTKLVSNLEDSEIEGALIQKKRAEEFTGSLDNQLYTVGANGKYSAVFGGKGYTGADAKYSMVFGTGNIAKSGCTFMIGDNCLSEPTSDKSSESFNSFVTGYANHVVGSAYSVTAGRNNILVESPLSFVVGSENEVHGTNAFVEGCQNFNGELTDIPTPEPGPMPEPDPYTATRGEGSHVGGIGNKNDSYYSFITGSNNINVGANYSFLTGYGNSAKEQAFTFTAGIFNENSKLPGKAVFGRYNKDVSNALFEVGTGTAETRQSDFYIDTNGQTHVSNLYVGQLSVMGGTINGKAQYAGQADKVTVNADGSYVGSLLVNSETNKDMIVRKDTINVTAAGKLVAGAQTIADDSDLTLVTKGYIDTKLVDKLDKAGGTISGNLTIGNGIGADGILNVGGSSLKISGGLGYGSIKVQSGLTISTNLKGSMSGGGVKINNTFIPEDAKLLTTNSAQEDSINLAALNMTIGGDLANFKCGKNELKATTDTSLTVNVCYDDSTGSDKYGYYVFPSNDGSTETNRHTLATREWVMSKLQELGLL